MDILSHYFIAYVITFITISCLGLFVYFKDRKRRLNQIYAIFSSTVACWSLFHAFVATSTNPTSALILSRLSNLGIIFIPSTYLHFVFVVLNVKREKMRNLVLAYSASLIFLISSFTRLLLPGVSPRISYNYIWSPGILYPLFVAFWFGCIIYALYELFKGFIQSSDRRRNQLKYLFFGSLIGYLGGAGNFLLIFDIEIYPYNPFGTYGVPIYTALVTYAIIAHNLLDLNIVIRKTLIYSGLISFITIINVVIIFLFENIFRGIFGYRSLLLTLCMASIIAITFFPLYRLITSLVDKLFFKKTMAALARENKMLKEEISRSEKLAALGVLSSGLAHEIKNPLVPIKTYIQNLPAHLQDTDKNSEFIKKITSIIPIEVDKISTLLNQLRDFAQPPQLNTTKTDLHKLIEGRLEFLDGEFSQRNIKIERSYYHDSINIEADSIQLERVFLNLFLNAIDTMPQGGKLRIATEITSNNKILAKISDTGIGIAKEDLSHIFDPFFSKGKYQGSGLGLAITHQIIKGHGGSIQIESTVNRGTTFYIYLPIKTIKNFLLDKKWAVLI